ncbi:protein kinase [Rhodoplanes serenus]|uniref:non-specific serine/threonine protein kinase n=1 Tax=Rhodoplanes serenus TaxID=200615 RepID=A0A9X4XQ36_9BRAD|nr:protein kinase [Rhodoplanes serenus]MTW19328.1 protein kinase [Rhodoplanes serenus]
MPLDHIPELIETGRHEGRAYEVTELVHGGTLADAGFDGSDDPERLRRIIDELGRALASFAEVGLRHRDLNPTTVCVRNAKPLDLVVTGFGSARLADFDLESVATLELTRYSAPEAIVGAVSAASDWWSLGMIVLEQATAGRCFDGVDDQAFRLHVVTRGVPLPEDLDPNIRQLLRGLLARDPLQRWSAGEVRAWLAGEPVEAPALPTSDTEPVGPVLTLAGRSFARPDAFALAGAEAGNWDAARDLVLRGAVATWLQDRKSDPKLVSLVRRIGSAEKLAEASGSP